MGTETRGGCVVKRQKEKSGRTTLLTLTYGINTVFQRQKEKTCSHTGHIVSVLVVQKLGQHGCFILVCTFDPIAMFTQQLKVV